MTSYQFVVYYFSATANAYFKIASAWLPTNDEDALTTIEGIFCGAMAIPDMRIAFVGDGKRKFRHMRNADVVEVAGKAYAFCVADTCITYWDEIEYRADHQYQHVF